jgi:hypothetical protein
MDTSSADTTAPATAICSIAADAPVRHAGRRAGKACSGLWESKLDSLRVLHSACQRLPYYTRSQVV